MDKKQRSSLCILLLNAFLAAVTAGAFAVTWYAFYNQISYTPFDGKGNFLFVAFYAAIYIYFGHLYGSFSLTVSRISELIYSNGVALLVTDCITYAVIWLLKRNELPNPLPLLACMAVCVLFDILWALISYRCVNHVMKPQKALIIYENENALAKGDSIIARYGNRFIPAGRISVSEGLDKVCGRITDIGAGEVLICGVSSSIRNDILKFCLNNHVTAYICPTIGDLFMLSAKQFRMNHFLVFRCQEASPSIVYLFIKRAFDIFVSALALILTSPFMLVTAIAIKAYDGGPVIFKQKRMTKGRKIFEIHKFRSMKVDADKDGMGIVTKQNDDRITPVGKVIRACRLDELPQLWDILVGNMSIVGPRPERIETIELYERETPEFALRLQVKGGLTGYAQVYGKANTSPYDKLQMDLDYIGQQSIVTDLKIMFATVKVIFMPESTEGFSADINVAETEREPAVMK